MHKKLFECLQIVSVPCHRINKRGTHAHHRDRSAAAAIFANGTYFLDNPRTYALLFSFSHMENFLKIVRQRVEIFTVSVILTSLRLLCRY